jgi:hypothetical protein
MCVLVRVKRKEGEVGCWLHQRRHHRAQVWEKPTFKALYALRDNYNATTGVVESDTPQVRS